MDVDTVGRNIRRAVRTAFAVLFALTLAGADLCAASIEWTCPSCQESFKFPSNASAYRNSFAQKHMAVCRPSGSSGGLPYGGGTGDPVFDAMMPVLDAYFQQLGQSLADELFGNPEQQRRQAEMRRIEQQRLEELERRRREEMARIRKELHEKLLSELMLLDATGNLSLMTISGSTDLTFSGANEQNADGTLEMMGMDDNLRPAGTSFFGQGGGSGQPQVNTDANVVDLRNLRRAAYLVQKAQGATATDAEHLIDEGLNVALGQPAFVAIDDRAVPVVSEEGLLAFQKANNDYRRARDSHMKVSERLARDDSQYEKAKALYEKAKHELEKAAASGDADLAEQQQLMSKLYDRLKELHDARLRTRADLESAENDMLWTAARRRSSLSDTIVPEPSVLPGILDKERQYLKPSIPDRLLHMRDRRVGEAHAREFDQYVQENYGFVDDPALSERIERLSERVRALSPYPDEPSGVRIIDMPRDPQKAEGLESGAWSTSDTIYFGKAYLDENPSDDEILFVAGHEIAHVQRGHYSRSLAARQDVTDAAEPDELIDWENSPLSDEHKLKIHEAVYRGALHDLNHEQEFEADRLGALMALSAGAKPGAFRELFADKPSPAVAKPRSAEDRLRELTSTHPASSLRLEKLRQIYGSAIDKAPAKMKKETDR